MESYWWRASIIGDYFKRRAKDLGLCRESHYFKVWMDAGKMRQWLILQCDLHDFGRLHTITQDFEAQVLALKRIEVAD